MSEVRAAAMLIFDCTETGHLLLIRETFPGFTIQHGANPEAMLLVSDAERRKGGMIPMIAEWLDRVHAHDVAMEV